MGSVGALVIGLLVHLLVMPPANGVAIPLYNPLFIIGLMLGGLVLTSMIFSDMHHPDECYFYLMQPISNFERFLSRYLISGPMFYLYFVVLYYLFEVIALFLSNYSIGGSAQFFEYGDSVIRETSRIYFAAHAVVLLGAIYFRSYSLVKIILTLAGLGLACLVVFWFSMRIIFWDYFPLLFSLVPRDDPATSFDPARWPAYIHWLLAIALYLWVLFVAYTTLQDHEA